MHINAAALFRHLHCQFTAAVDIVHTLSVSKHFLAEFHVQQNRFVTTRILRSHQCQRRAWTGYHLFNCHTSNSIHGPANKLYMYSACCVLLTIGYQLSVLSASERSMERFLQYRDKGIVAPKIVDLWYANSKIGTGIAPFLPVPTQPSGKYITIHVFLFFIRLSFLLPVIVSYFLVVQWLPIGPLIRKAYLWLMLGIPGIWWIDLQIDGVRRGHAFTDHCTATIANDQCSQVISAAQIAASTAIFYHRFLFHIPN